MPEMFVKSYSVAYCINRDFVFIIIVQFMMSANSGHVLACKSHSFICVLHHLIIIIVQTYLETLTL